MRAPLDRDRWIRRTVIALALLCAVPAPRVASQETAPAAPAAVVAPVADTPVAGAATVEAMAVDPMTGLPLAPNTVDAALLPHDLSPSGMFLQADWVVKAVMIGLALASIVTWTVALAKSLELAAARRRARHTLRVLATAVSLPGAVGAMRAGAGAGAALVRSAEEELRLSAGLDAAGIKERLALVLDRIVHAAGRQAGKATGLLATIGATAPFVGLFGTVWGIMNAFIGISRAQTTNLAVVAPGIAEALLATAIGLIAAIPAVVLYNHFARVIAAYRALLGDIAAAIMQLVSRDLDCEARLLRAGLRREAAE